jgi:hypothetical protein
MKPIPLDFWAQPDDDDLPLPLPPFTDEDLRAAEARLGLRLPESLVRLLRTQNGGYPNYFMYAVYRPPKSFDDYMEIRELWGISAKPLSYGALDNYEVDFMFGGEDPDEEMRQWRKHLGDERRIIPFCGDGHSYFSLDYRGIGDAEEPPVIIMYVEAEEFCWEVIAESFEEVFDHLEKEDDLDFE